MCLNAYLNPWNVLVLLGFDDTYILKLIFPLLGFDLWSCVFISCIYVFFQTLRYTCIPLESFAFNANLFIWTQLCLRDMYVYLLCCQNIHISWNIYFLIKKYVMIFMFSYLKKYWALLTFSWYHVPHNTSALTPFENFMDFMDIRVFLVPCDLLVFHEKYFCFIPYLKDFVLVLKHFHIN